MPLNGMEDKEKEREEKGAILEEALNRTGIYTFSYYPQEKRITVPENACQIYGCRSEYENMPYSFAEEFVHPDYREAFYRIYDTVLGGELTASGIFSNLDRQVYFRVTLSVVKQESGRPVYAIGIIENLTDEMIKEQTYKEQLQKKNEELKKRIVLEQEEMNRRMATILNGISGGFKISRNDEKFSYVYVSEALPAFLGYTMEEFLQVSNGNVMDFVYADDVEETYRKEQEDMTKGDTYSCKYRVRCKDGTLKWIIDSGKLIPTESGEEHFYSLYLDVDELERSRLEQKEALALLEQIVGANACGIFAYTLPDYKVLQVNEEAMRLLGWKKGKLEQGDAVYQYVMDDLVEEDRMEIRRLSKGIKKPGDSFSTTYRLQRDGKIYAKVQLESKRLKMPNGHEMILSTLVDIFEKSKMEEALNESLQAFHIASQEARNIVVVYDTMAQSAKFERKIPCPFSSASPVKGVPYETVNNGTVAEESKAEYLRIHEAIIRGEKEADGIVKRIALDGHEMVMRLRFQAVLDSNGFPTGKAVGVYMDITKEYLREAEQTARMESIQKNTKLVKNRYKDVIRALSDDYFAIYLVDICRNIIETVRAGDKLLPQVADSIGSRASYSGTIARYVENYVHPEDKERVAEGMSLRDAARRLAEEKVFYLRYRRVCGDICEYTEFKMMDVSEEQDASRGVLAVRSVDSEVQKDLEQQSLLREALTQAQYASRAKTVFLSNMSHDIRTPMNAIVGFSSIAAKHLEDAKRVEDCLIKIQAASGHLQSLINDILDMSRIESGKMVVKEEKCSLPELTHSVLSVIQPQLRTKKLRFSARTIDVHNEIVYTDALKLRQILVNILGNAVKFTQPGGSICFTVQQSPSSLEGRARYRFIISDTGIGMSREFQKHIFEPFERETTSTLSQTEGTGLGMSITKSIVDAMAGSITLESVQGEGSTFTVELDIKILADLLGQDSAESNSGTDGEEAGQLFPDRDRFVGARVLLVEDNELNREIATELLSEEGFLVECAENGAKAVSMLEKSEEDYYRLVLMDIQMPVMNGYDAARRIRNMKREDLSGLPIIAMTANAFEEDKETALKCGMNDHVSKPINVDDMLEKIGRLL